MFYVDLLFWEGEERFFFLVLGVFFFGFVLGERDYVFFPLQIFVCFCFAMICGFSSCFSFNLFGSFFFFFLIFGVEGVTKQSVAD